MERLPAAESISRPGSLTTLNSTIAINSERGAARAAPASLAGRGCCRQRQARAVEPGAGGLGGGSAGTRAVSGTGGGAGGARRSRRRRRCGSGGQASATTGGAVTVGGGTATLDNTTVALNTGGCGRDRQRWCVAAISTLFAGNGSTDYQGNIIATDSLFQTAPTGTLTGSGNLVGVNPLLATQGLANNGGPTETIALQPGSPADLAGPIRSRC